MNFSLTHAIPTWVFVTGGLFLYLLIGFIHAAVMSYWSGKNSRLWVWLVCESPLGFTVLWPCYDLLNAVFWVFDKYSALMDWFKKKGQESTLPPKNSVTDVPEAPPKERYYDSL